MSFTIRKAEATDRASLETLYKAVASVPGGIARTADEITAGYIDRILNTSLSKGLIFVCEEKDWLVGSIHAYQLEPKVFRHILSDLTIAVHPDFQGKGIGRSLFQKFLSEVSSSYPHILRVELIARTSNERGLSLYRKLGFIQEGRLERRILPESGVLEADIPMAWFNPHFKK